MRRDFIRFAPSLCTNAPWLYESVSITVFLRTERLFFMKRGIYHTPQNILSKRKLLVPLSAPQLPCTSSLSSVQPRKTTSTWPSFASQPKRTCIVYSIKGGLVPYEQAWVWQQRLLHERMAWQREATPPESHDVLLLLEHPAVYTLGRGSTLDNLRFDPDDPACKHEVRRTERGGEVTWHGPGQLVGYPVLDLNYHKKDLHWYLRQLEEVIIKVLAKNGLQGERETEHTGVWVNGAKVAAIGLNASRWITSHGFSLNVNPDLTAFEAIVPCGIQGRPVTRLHDLVAPQQDTTAPTAVVAAGAGAATERPRAQILQAFEDVFGLDMLVKEVDGDAPPYVVEAKLFPTGCDNQKLLERLKLDGRRQLQLGRRR